MTRTWLLQWFRLIAHVRFYLFFSTHTLFYIRVWRTWHHHAFGPFVRLTLLPTPVPKTFFTIGLFNSNSVHSSYFFLLESASESLWELRIDRRSFAERADKMMECSRSRLELNMFEFVSSFFMSSIASRCDCYKFHRVRKQSVESELSNINGELWTASIRANWMNVTFVSRTSNIKLFIDPF